MIIYLQWQTQTDSYTARLCRGWTRSILPGLAWNFTKTQLSTSQTGRHLPGKGLYNILILFSIIYTKPHHAVIALVWGTCARARTQTTVHIHTLVVTWDIRDGPDWNVKKTRNNYGSACARKTSLNHGPFLWDSHSTDLSTRSVSFTIQLECETIYEPGKWSFYERLRVFWTTHLIGVKLFPCLFRLFHLRLHCSKRFLGLKRSSFMNMYC